MTKLKNFNDTLNLVGSNLNSYTSKVGSLQSNLGTFSTILTANYDPITNPNYGSFYGQSCKPILESIQNFRDSICIGIFNSMNYNLICLAITCWSICIISCFATCTGVRHYNHIKKM